MSEGLSIVSYLGAAILFILCLGGLSNQETARRGNLYGIIGMAIAVLATVFGPRVGAAGLLGEQFIGIEPGGDSANLASGDTIAMTQSAIVLENLIGQFLYSRAADGNAK